VDKRPDELYLMSIIENIERATGEWDMKDQLAQEGDVVIENTVLHEISMSFKVEEELHQGAVAVLFAKATDQFVELINDNGYNICRPLGIRDPSMQAKDGTIQLCKRGTKLSMYMSHRFNAGITTVTLKMLVGKQ